MPEAALTPPDAIDFHAHLDSSWDCADELAACGDRAGTARTIVVSGNMLDTSRLGDYLRGTHSLRDPAPNNAFLLEVARRARGRFLPFFTIDPWYHDETDVVEARAAGFWGFKLNPIVHRVDMTDQRLAAVLEPLDGWQAPLYLHITLNPVASLEAVVRLARRFSGVNFVVGHMGFATADGAALDACEAIENVFLETSIGSMLAYREARRRRLAGKVLYGSEFPTHDPQIELDKLRLIFAQDELQMITRANAERLLSWRADAPRDPGEQLLRDQPR